MKRATLTLALSLAVLPLTARAISYSEAADGDLSGDRLAPTALVLEPGSNLVTGNTIFGDLDYVTISIPAQLSAIVLTQYATQLNTVSFVGVQTGTVFTLPASTPDPSQLLGWAHFGDTLEGTDILDDIGVGFGSQGFVPPLPAGNYTFWIQETGVYLADYQFDFVVVPEPASLVLAALGIGALALRRAAS
jgi:hypothetical protein